MPKRAYASETVWGNDAYAHEPLPALHALRAKGQLPASPHEVARVPRADKRSIVVEVAGLGENQYLCTVRDHQAAVYIALVQDNGIVETP